MRGLGQQTEQLPSFVVEDDRGREITYRWHPRPTKAGYEMIAIIDRAIAGAQLEMVPDALVDRAQKADPAEARARNVRLLAVHAAGRIVASGNFKEARQILEHVRRMDPDTGDPVALDELGVRVYQGNYGELERAIAELLIEEFGGFLAGRLAAPNQAAAKLETMAMTLFRTISSRLREAGALSGPSTSGGTPPDASPT